MCSTTTNDRRSNTTITTATTTAVYFRERFLCAICSFLFLFALHGAVDESLYPRPLQHWAGIIIWTHCTSLTFHPDVSGRRGTGEVSAHTQAKMAWGNSWEHRAVPSTSTGTTIRHAVRFHETCLGVGLDAAFCAPCQRTLSVYR